MLASSPGTAADNGVLLGLLLAIVVATVVWLVRRGSPVQGDALDQQPLLPGEARWIVARDGTVTDSCTHEADTGIATGWAVGHPIWTWAPSGSVAAEAYRAAIEDRHPATFEDRHKDASGAERVARVALQPRADGSVYCESWDVTEYVAARDAAKARATAAESRARTAAASEARFRRDIGHKALSVLADGAPDTPAASPTA